VIDDPAPESPRPNDPIPQVTKRPSQQWAKTSAQVGTSPKPLPQIKNSSMQSDEGMESDATFYSLFV
jgi:hypothetical protein